MELIQSIAGGYGAGGAGPLSTSSVGFAADTLAGSLLICVLYATGTNAVPNPPTTAGVTWIGLAAEGYTGTLQGAVSIYASYNTPIIPSTSLTQAVIGTDSTVDVEFDLYEFGDLLAAPFDVSAVGTGPTSGSVTKNPTAVNQTGPYVANGAGWQGYLPTLFNGSGGYAVNGHGVINGHTSDPSVVYVNSFGFSIPSTATIEGVEVFFLGGVYTNSGASPSGAGVTITLQHPSGTGIGSPKTVLFGPTYSSEPYNAGDSTDTWSASLSPAVVNSSSFGVGFLEVDAHSTDKAPVIASCYMTIWYTDPGEATQTPNVVTHAVDLIFVAGQGADSSGSFAPVGTGYTLGVQTFLCNYGEAQYLLNAPAGSTATAFGSPMGGQNWCCAAVAFKGTASNGTATPTGLRMTTTTGPTQPGVPIWYGGTGGAPLPPGVNDTYFYVRWVGYLTPSVTGIYTVGLNYSDGADFYIGSQPIVTDLTGSQTPEPLDPSTGLPQYVTISSIRLTKNIAYPIIIEWQHAGDPSVFELQFLWTPPSRTNGPPGMIEVIPEANISLVGSWWNGTSSSWYPTAWY